MRLILLMAVTLSFWLAPRAFADGTESKGGTPVRDAFFSAGKAIIFAMTQFEPAKKFADQFGITPERLREVLTEKNVVVTSPDAVELKDYTKSTVYARYTPGQPLEIDQYLWSTLVIKDPDQLYRQTLHEMLRFAGYDDDNNKISDQMPPFWQYLSTVPGVSDEDNEAKALAQIRYAAMKKAFHLAEAPAPSVHAGLFQGYCYDGETPKKHIAFLILGLDEGRPWLDLQYASPLTPQKGSEITQALAMRQGLLDRWKELAASRRETPTRAGEVTDFYGVPIHPGPDPQRLRGLISEKTLSPDETLQSGQVTLTVRTVNEAKRAYLRKVTDALTRDGVPVNRDEICEFDRFSK